MNKLGDEKFNQEFVVIDTETTGFGKTDRIIEIACVVFSGNQIIEEYSTLINPNRDVGKTQIHGIRPSMVTSAPLFSEIAIDILRILQNRVIVAHNLAFDLRMLKQEFEKIQIDFNAGRGVCTMTEVSRIYSAQNSSLHKACEIFEIQQHDMHHALGDARATFELFQALNPNLKNVDVVSNSFDKSKIPSRTLTRKAFEPQELVSISKIQSITKKVPFPSSEESFISYFQVLNLVLEDLVISTVEMIELRNWSEQLNISNKELEKLHSDYLDSFVQATLRDGVVTLDEMEMLTKIANSLNLPLELPEAA